MTIWTYNAVNNNSVELTNGDWKNTKKKCNSTKSGKQIMVGGIGVLLQLSLDEDYVEILFDI